jgi:acyl-CoA dehydrogenase
MQHLEWPFFDDAHRRFAAELAAWADDKLSAFAHGDDADAACRHIVAELGRAGWLGVCVPGESGGRFAGLDVRAICLGRETLAQREPLADFAFAMQGLGSGPISLFGSDGLRARYLPRVRAGEAIAAFALSEAGAGSDAAALTTRARPDGDGFVIDGEKTWISNGGIADFYVVFARTTEGEGSRGITAFAVDADTPGLDASARIASIAPHPLATLRFTGCRVSAERVIGAPGEGFKIAMATLDVFRASVAAAALGFARRALAEALARSQERTLFGRRLADLQLTQAALADMATAVDASALLTYRAAWTHDRGEPATREVAMAKMFATESAQRVVDRAVQLFGALGVMQGHVAERLYREVRALRIYEGATEIQQLVVARELLGRRSETAVPAGRT